MLTERTFSRLLSDRLVAGVAALLLLTGGLGAAGTRVKPDFGIELLFPSHVEARQDYDRFKESFPFEDAHALVLIEAPDLFTPAGLGRLQALEQDLEALDQVEETQGLLTVEDVVDRDDTLTVEPLIPGPDADPAVLAKARERATTDPLFAWRIAPPTGDATTLRVTLTREDAKDEARRSRFLRAAREVIARHDAAAKAAGATQTLTLTGMPIVRSEGVELVNRDTAVLMPVAFGLITLLLLLTFAHVGDVAAALVTIGASVIWAVGAMGLLGYPLHVLTNVTPLVVMIVSVSDTAHIVAHTRDLIAKGAARRDAIAAATAEAAIPCLLTEVVIAGGFLGLLGADMVMIQQFGVATAAGVLLTWLANVTVLPLALLALGARAVSPRPTGARRGLARAVAAIEYAVREHPRVVLGVTLVVVGVALILGTRVGREYYNFDDLPPTSAIKRHLAKAEAIHGGVVPLALFVEPTGELADEDEPLLDPRAIALLDVLEQRLEAFPEVENALSLASYLRKAHRLLAGDAAADAHPLPQTRALVAQELFFIDTGELLGDVLSFDRRAACVIAAMPDRGSTRARELLAELEPFVKEQTAGIPFKVTFTGNFMIADAVYQSLVGGLVKSLGVAILVTFAAFCLVLRSWRLALIGLVPNVLPLALTLGFMSLLGIDLKPSTVIVFSITLVIADDDTIQYLARFRRRYDELVLAGDPELHSRAAFEVLRETGEPMMITTAVISLGFLCFCFSEFEGIVHLGLLIGVSLITALLADLFLSPLMLVHLRPKIGGRGPGPTAGDGAAP